MVIANENEVLKIRVKHSQHLWLQHLCCLLHKKYRWRQRLQHILMYGCSLQKLQLRMIGSISAFQSSHARGAWPRHKLDGKYLQLMLIKFRLETDMRFTEIHLNNTLVFIESNRKLTVVVMPIIVAFRRTESF